MHNFDRIINRDGTDSYKLDLCDAYFGTNDLLPLWVADMDFAAPKAVQEALAERVDHDIYGYTVRKDDFSNAITSWLGRMHSWKVGKETVEFTPGVLPAIVVALHEFTKPGDKVIIQTPVYPPFYSIVKDNGRELLTNSLVATDGYYNIDFDNLEELAKDPQTTMFVFSNPHNPVGRAWKLDELERIVKICSDNGVMIVSDEIHSDLCLFGNKHYVLANEFPEYSQQIITCMAPSKTFNIAGFSTAYAIITDKHIRTKFHSRLVGLQMHMGNLFGGIALEAAYNNGDEWLMDMKAYLEANILMVDAFIKENMPEIIFVVPEATYLLWFDFKAWDLSPAKLRKAMIEIGKIGMNDGVSFGVEGKGFQRMNIASPKAMIAEGLGRILKVRNAVYKH